VRPGRRANHRQEPGCTADVAHKTRLHLQRPRRPGHHLSRRLSIIGSPLERIAVKATPTATPTPTTEPGRQISRRRVAAAVAWESLHTPSLSIARLRLRRTHV